MRLVTTLVILMLLPSAPALAEDSINVMKWFTPSTDRPVQAAPSAKSAHKKKPVAAHAAPAATPAPEPKPAETNSTEAKSTETNPAETKPAETKPAAAKTDKTDKAEKPAKPEKPAPAAKTVKSATAKSDAGPDVFAGIPITERLKIQAALLWAGDYSATTKSEDPMLAAIKNYQKRKKTSATGVLTAAERADLVDAAKNHEEEFGWSVVADPATGIRIGLPSKMVPNARDTDRGTRWSSALGDVQVETFRIVDSELKLSALFEQQKKEPANRKIETSVLRDDNFFISGFQGLKKFSVRAYMRNGEVRGFTMMYDQMMETIVTPVMVAMASAFSPFPERSAPFAATAKSVEYGNGLVVSAQGHIITDAKLTQSCQVMIASGFGDAVRIAEDKDSGLALLRVYGPRKFSVLALPRELPRPGDLTLIGLPDPKEQGGSRKLTEIKARLIEGSAIELRQPVPMAGFSGAAALDAKGQFLGMMEMRNAVLASAEPAAPPVRLIAADTIRTFLSKHHVAGADTQTGDAKASVVRMICVRK
ncbi:MAG: trypsin-like peptidase domain-containing protein [Pseudolabrys sp.]